MANIASANSAVAGVSRAGLPTSAGTDGSRPVLKGDIPVAEFSAPLIANSAKSKSSLESCLLNEHRLRSTSARTKLIRSTLPFAFGLCLVVKRRSTPKRACNARSYWFIQPVALPIPLRSPPTAPARAHRLWTTDGSWNIQRVAKTISGTAVKWDPQRACSPYPQSSWLASYLISIWLQHFLHNSLVWMERPLARRSISSLAGFHSCCFRGARSIG